MHLNLKLLIILVALGFLKPYSELVFIWLKLTLREHEKIAHDSLLLKVNDNHDCNRYRFHSSLTLLSGKKEYFGKR